MDDRKHMGRSIKGVIIPVAPSLNEVGEHYFNMRDSVVKRIKECRAELVIRANAAMTTLYWHIGNEILQRQSAEGWGARVIDRLSKDLSDAFPEMKGFSARNLKYMRKFAESFDNEQIVQQVVAQLPWRGIITLLDKVSNNDERLWYAQMSLKSGWSSNVLGLMIGARLRERQGQSITNFDIAMPSPDSDMNADLNHSPTIMKSNGAAVSFMSKTPTQTCYLRKMVKYTIWMDINRLLLVAHIQ